MDSEQFRAKLIKNATNAEINLLYALSNDTQLRGKYNYQYKFPPYFVDFYFPEYSLVVEVDGWSHDHRHIYDNRRTRIIKRRYGIKYIVRFTNKEVHKEIKTVINSIKKFIPSNGKKNMVSFYGINKKAFKNQTGTYHQRRRVNFERMKTI